MFCESDAKSYGCDIFTCMRYCVTTASAYTSAGPLSLKQNGVCTLCRHLKLHRLPTTQHNTTQHNQERHTPQCTAQARDARTTARVTAVAASKVGSRGRTARPLLTVLCAWSLGRQCLRLLATLRWLRHVFFLRYWEKESFWGSSAWTTTSSGSGILGFIAYTFIFAYGDCICG